MTMSRFAFFKLSALVAVLVLATPAVAQSTDEHHDDQAPQTLPAPAFNGMPGFGMPGLGMPGLGMTGPMGPLGGGGAQSPGMGRMMQMMQMMEAMQGGGMPRGMPGAIGGMGAAGGDVEQLIAGYKAALAIT